MLENLFQQEGWPTTVASGTVTSGFTGNCMDAYGSSASGEPDTPAAVAGQIVAINTCNSNPAQDWAVWSNGAVSVWGLCLDTNGGTAPDGGKLTDLEVCDSSSSQVWNQVGQTLVNQATGYFLTDPGGHRSPGTRLEVSPSTGSTAQQWQLPGAPSGSPPPNSRPCDIYAAYGTACAAAYSTTRALYSAYDGPLYQVQRASDGATDNIGLLATGGYVNAAAQDSFCSGTQCTITEIYDQSPKGNNLTIEGPSAAGGAADSGSPAAALPITINGTKAYGVTFLGRMGYRDNNANGTAVNGQAEGMYMVTSGTHVNSGCCFDFGNMERNSADNGNGHMDAVNFGTNCYFPPCSGGGPWVAADMENGLFQGGNGSNTNNLGNTSNFVTAMLKNNGQTTYALKGGDAQSGALSTWYAGPLPNLGGYTPMQQEGAIGLGIGGDGSNAGIGSFFEGVMTAGYPSDAADSAVQTNIAAAGHAGNSNGSGGGVGPPNGSNEDWMPSAAGQAVVHSAGATGCGAYGFSSVYTVDASNGDLQETYLDYIGDGWRTQDLSANYGTPPTSVTPTAVVHTAGATGASQGCGFASVYTIDASNGHLQETYLPNAGFPGDPWHTQDLSANYGGPPLLTGTSPVAIVHIGWTSVYYVNAANGLEEAYLPAIGSAWTFQSLSANYGTPSTSATPIVLLHPDANGNLDWTSVFTIDGSSADLQETYLSNVGFPGDPWQTQDLSARYGTPPATGNNSGVAGGGGG